MITDTHMSYSDLDISEKTKKIQNFMRHLPAGKCS